MYQYHQGQPHSQSDSDYITKLPESSDLCGNITEFRVGKDHLIRQGEGDPAPPQTK